VTFIIEQNYIKYANNVTS